MQNAIEESYLNLLRGNRDWVDKINASDSDFFTELNEGQEPEFLWIGCSDSRVPANQITGSLPGDMFVHRNIANLVVHTDINLLSVLQYAVEMLKVKHIIVCGHYNCGGVKAAMSAEQHGLIDNWLRNIKDVYRLHQGELDAIREGKDRFDRLVELNVVEQVYNVCKTSIVQNAWAREQPLHVHGWVYRLHTGMIRDLDVTVRDNSELDNIYQFRDIFD